MAGDLALSSRGNLGFLSVLHEPAGYAGGYLVTNAWGRPLEFRLTSPLQPNRVQQILYGATLPAYVCGELIGRTLIDKTTTVVPCVITDNSLALDLRLRLEVPVALWQSGAQDAPGLFVQPNLYCHRQYPDDVATLRGVLEKLGTLDLGEPFIRIREAMSEARKLGGSNRLAA
jgi:hypothetical protein